MVDYLRIKEMHRMQLNGLGYQRIAYKMGTSKQNVHSLLKNYSVGKIYVSKPKSRTYKINVRREVVTPEFMPNVGAAVNRKLVRFMQGRDRNRELVRLRDNHTCQGCSKHWKPGKRRFDVHHLRGLCGRRSTGYDKLSDANILVTLCHKCHFNHHKFKPTMKRLESS